MKRVQGRNVPRHSKVSVMKSLHWGTVQGDWLNRERQSFYGFLFKIQLRIFEWMMIVNTGAYIQRMIVASTSRLEYNLYLFSTIKKKYL